jgi:hypothetical protein
VFWTHALFILFNLPPWFMLISTHRFACIFHVKTTHQWPRSRVDTLALSLMLSFNPVRKINSDQFDHHICQTLRLKAIVAGRQVSWFGRKHILREICIVVQYYKVLIYFVLIYWDIFAALVERVVYIEWEIFIVVQYYKVLIFFVLMYLCRGIKREIYSNWYIRTMLKFFSKKFLKS